MKPEMRDMAGLYAVGALSPAEAAEFEAYMRTSPEAQAEVAEFLATAARLGDAVAEAPPAAMKDRVLAEVAQTRQEPPVVTALASRRPLWRRAVPLAVAAAVILVLGIVGIRLNDRVNDLETEQAVLAAADAVTVELDGDDGSLRVVWSASERRAAVVGDGVAMVSSDQTYELWRIADGEFDPVGLFRPDGDGDVLSIFDADDLIDDNTILAVTVEAAGGVDQPTGDPVFASRV